MKKRTRKRKSLRNCNAEKFRLIILSFIYLFVIIAIIFNGHAKKEQQMNKNKTETVSSKKPKETEMPANSQAVESNVLTSPIDSFKDSSRSTHSPSFKTTDFKTGKQVDIEKKLNDISSMRMAENNGILTVINASQSLPEDWEVSLVELRNGQAIDERAYGGLQQMFDDARAEGLDPLICSSYRTMEKQQQLFDNEVDIYLEQGYDEDSAKAIASTWVAYPGTSEHQLGLTVDICSVSNQILDSSQEDTDTQKWLMANSYKYGFILRYPSDKSDITGISYEPWHYRYVGVEAATYIYEHGLCLEEYVEEQR